MIPILLIGLSLFICSAVAIYLTLRASSVTDLHRKPMRKRGLLPLKSSKNRGKDSSESISLIDREHLDDSANSLEGAVFFF